MIHRLHGRLTHLLALPPTGARLDLRVLAVMLPETDIHVALNVGDVVQNILDDTLLNRPAEEIELADRRLLNRRFAADLEADSFAPAEGIKQSL